MRKLLRIIIAIIITIPMYIGIVAFFIIFSPLLIIVIGSIFFYIYGWLVGSKERQEDGKEGLQLFLDFFKIANQWLKTFIRRESVKSV